MKIKRGISILMVAVLLFSLLPVTTLAVEAPVWEHAEAGEVPSFSGDADQQDTQETEPPHPAIWSRQSRASGDKMDTSYLSISMEKYGETISASSINSNQVEVLEYTQWQMSARFVRVYEGQVVEDKDVTSQCVWTSSDSSGQTLTVTKDGMVTVYGATDREYSITANYLGMVNMSGTSDMTEKNFTTNMSFTITQLEFLNEYADQMRCLALTQLLKNDWPYLKNSVGRTVSEWAAEVQTALLQNTSSVLCSDETLIYLNKANNSYTNSARILHFISAAAGDCIIGQYMFAGESEMVLMGTFSRGSQKYMVFQFGAGGVDVIKSESFASDEANGKRKTEYMADLQYRSVKEYFQAGMVAYHNEYQQGDDVTVTGEYFGGTIAKYVSYMTGCKALTFNAPSPIQYVFRFNLPELCKNYNVNNQKSFVFQDYLSKSTMYSIEPTYHGLREYGSGLEYLWYDGDAFISIGWTPKTRQKEQSLWNRYIYLGSDERDVYKDTAALTIKLTESAMFGGAGADDLTVKAASKPIIDFIAQPTGKIKTVLNLMGIIPEEIKKATWYKTLNGANVIYNVFNLTSRSFLDTNIISGGSDNDIIYGAWRNNSFCVTPADGNDTYILKGMGNRFFLMGYGDDKVSVSHRTSEDNTKLYISVNYREQFIIDISDLYFSDIEFYQGSPFDEELEVIYRIKPLYERADMNYWKYSCPVDVLVLDPSGNIVQELRDGQEYSEITDYGVFDVSLENGEYVKSVVLLEENYSIQVRGVGNGTMKFCHTSFNYDKEDGQYCSVENIPVTQGAIYYPSDNLTVSLMTVDIDGNGTVDDTITYDTTIAFRQDNYKISYGTQQLLKPDVSTSSTDRDCFWISTDDSVVTVNDDGTLTAVGFGEAEIYAMVADGSGAYDSCKVTVPQENLSAENFVVTGLESTYEYTGEPINVQLSVSYGCFPLVQDVHYTAEFSELLEPGKATLTITGINDYSGTLTLDYEIRMPKEPETVSEKVDWIADQCRQEGITDPWEIALWLHDWLIYNANYDYTYTYYHPEGVLLMGTGVCQSYAEAYSLLLDEFSIENMVLSAPQMDHAWNLVKLNGEWCHVDCTWDDPGTGGSENRIYFGMNDDLMSRDHVWSRGEYPVCTSNINYYYIRNSENTVDGKESAEALFSKFAEMQIPTFECYYVGDGNAFSLVETFLAWYEANNWKYGILGYSITYSEMFLQAELIYGQPWDPPADPVLGAICPNFTLRGPNGTYPLSNYQDNGMVLIFGRETCGNTIAYLDELHPNLAEFQAMGLPVFVNLDPAAVPSDLVSIQKEYPGFIYTYYDSFLMSLLRELVGDTDWSVTFPVVFMIDKDFKIVHYATGAGQSANTLMEQANSIATYSPIPTPEAVDPNYLGSVFNYTGDQTALDEMIARELENRMPYLLVRDGVWDSSEGTWDSQNLGNIVINALNPYRDSPEKYELPYGWTYYPSMQWILVDIVYPENPGHTEHVPMTVEGYESTCTQDGLTEGSICSVCGEILVPQEIIPATGHNAVTDPAVDPDCTNAGKTEGKHCSVCGEILIPQEEIPSKGHSGEIDPAVDPDCTNAGKTEGKHCSVCGEILVPQEEISANGHSEVQDAAVAPTCSATGLTAGSHCSVCGMTLVPQEVVSALGHTDVIDPAVDPTCKDTGLTEGSHCDRCGRILVPQTIVEKLPHTEEMIPAMDPTCSATGLTEGKKCSVCGEIILVQETVEMLEHTPEVLPAKDPDCVSTGLTEGSKCSICGTTLVAQEVVPALGHAPEAVPGYAATCTEAGMTGGERCSACGVVIKEQTTIPASGHSWNNGLCGTCGKTCEHSYDDDGNCTICGGSCEHSYEAVVTAPTCTAQGYSTYTCTLCGCSYIGDYTDATNHSWMDATCIAPKTCANCGITDGGPNGHNYESTVTAPTCTEQGYTIHTCHCGDSFADDYIPALGHTPGAPLEENRVEPTCTEKGSYESVVCCSTCGTELGRENEIIPALGHSSGTAVTENEKSADCIHEGSFDVVVYCSICNAELSREKTILPANGIHTEEIDVAVDPTCTTTGLTEGKHCAVCGEVLVKQEVVSKKEHSFGDWYVTKDTTISETGEERRDCIDCGSFEVREIEQIPVAAVIGEMRYENLSDALAAAQRGDTVTLTADVKTSVLTIVSGVTLELGAYNLTADYVVAFKDAVISVTPNAGRLIVPKGNLILSEAGTNEKGQSILPVWDPNNGSYVFSLFVANTGNDARGLFINEEEGTLFFQWKHQATGAINKGLMADNGSSDNDVSMLVRLQWGDEDGVAYQNYVFKDSFVQKAAGSFDYTVTLMGIETLGIDLNTLVVMAIITTESGAETVGTAWTIENAK